jgi:hypothetical protein
MAAIDKLKALIREEVRKVIREEINSVLKENKRPVESYQQSIEKKVKKSPMKVFDQSNPFSSLLNETAMSFTSNDVSSFGNTRSVNAMDFFQPNEVKSGTVDDMLKNARKSSNIEAIEINTVPDYSSLMKKMNI